MSLSRRELKFFNVAKAVSKTSDYHGAKIGCVVCIGNNILSVASNSEKTHSLQCIYNRFRDFDTETSANKLHAEVHALSLIYRRHINWSKVEIYMYRELKNGTPAISKPCPACENLIHDLGIRTMFYINEKGKYVKERIY